MNAPQCDLILDSYASWLRDQFELREDAGACRLLLPQLLPDNTQLSVSVVRRPDGLYDVTDFGETVDQLFLSGLSLRTDDRRLTRIAERLGIDIDGGEFTKASDTDGLSAAIHTVARAILDASYLIYTRSSRRLSTFHGEVENFLAFGEIRYEPGYEVAGKSDIQEFDYYIPTRQTPLLVETLSATSAADAREKANEIAFKAIDVKEAGATQLFRFVCLVDDRTADHQDAITQRVRGPLLNYLNDVLLWSERQKLTSLLAA